MNKEGLVIGLSDTVNITIKTSFIPDLIFSSPQKGARMTVNLLLPDHEIIFDSTLKERNFGYFEDKPKIVIGVNEMRETIYAHRDEVQLIGNGGDPQAEVEIDPAFLDSFQNEEEKVIAIESHGSLSQCLLNICLGRLDLEHHLKNLNMVRYILEEDGTVSSL